MLSFWDAPPVTYAGFKEAMKHSCLNNIIGSTHE